MTMKKMGVERSRIVFSTTVVRSTFVAVVIALLSSSSSKASRSLRSVEAFAVSRRVRPFPPSSSSSSSPRCSSRVDVVRRFSSTSPDSVDDVVAVVVRAPLRYVGPYPCLAMSFPASATASQRARNASGIELDFVLDTAANVNVLQESVALELGLDVAEDSPAPPGVSAAGPMAGGRTYVLGDAELRRTLVVDDELRGGDATVVVVENTEPFPFMQNLTAAALPVANPGTAGVLGLAFFCCFEGGVEFRWGSSTVDDELPSVTFHGSNDGPGLKRALSGLTRVPIEPVPVTRLPSVRLRVNGAEMVALLDTGSPVTVLNKRAAREAGVATIKDSLDSGNDDASSSSSSSSWNPFASAMRSVRESRAAAEAASRGDVLTIGGVDGRPARLYRSSAGASLSLAVDDDDDDDGGGASLGGDDARVYVGDLPGLAALDGLGVDSPPAAVLGLDVLRRRPRMVFRPRENQLFL